MISNHLQLGLTWNESDSYSYSYSDIENWIGIEKCTRILRTRDKTPTQTHAKMTRLIDRWIDPIRIRIRIRISNWDSRSNFNQIPAEIGSHSHVCASIRVLDLDLNLNVDPTICCFGPSSPKRASKTRPSCAALRLLVIIIIVISGAIIFIFLNDIANSGQRVSMALRCIALHRVCLDVRGFWHFWQCSFECDLWGIWRAFVYWPLSKPQTANKQTGRHTVGQSDRQPDRKEDSQIDSQLRCEKWSIRPANRCNWIRLSRLHQVKSRELRA